MNKKKRFRGETGATLSDIALRRDQIPRCAVMRLGMCLIDSGGKSSDGRNARFD